MASTKHVHKHRDNADVGKYTHKYYLAEVGWGRVWACAEADCSHFMPSHMAHLVNGKASICWDCGNEMRLDNENMKDTYPTCIECRNRDNEGFEALTEIFSNSEK